MKNKLIKIYNILYKYYGPQNWWPGDTAFEVVIGAILTQNTAWTNVEKAIINLKREKVLNAKKLTALKEKKLAQFIRPAGYYNMKAKRIKNFLKFLNENYNGSLVKMFKKELLLLRKELLSVNGLGPETVDSILLYAGNKPFFVVDAYTKRIFSRHHILDINSSYETVQKYFMENLPKDVKIFNEYHALIVLVGKELCKKKPKCEQCPLNSS